MNFMSSRSLDGWQKRWEMSSSGATAVIFTKLQSNSYVAERARSLRFAVSRRKLADVQIFSSENLLGEDSSVFLKNRFIAYYNFVL